MWAKNDPRWLIPGGLFTAAVVGLILYRAFVVQPVVPKPRFWPEAVPVHVCPGLELDRIEAAADRLPACDFEFTVAESCQCVSVGERDIPRGYVEFITGPIDEDPVTNFLVRGKDTWTNESGEVEPAGEMVGACIVAPSFGTVDLDLELVYAHELAHACGYAHAVGDPTGTNARLHLMSTNHDAQGSDDRGMDLATGEQGNLPEGTLNVSEAP